MGALRGNLVFDVKLAGQDLAAYVRIFSAGEEIALLRNILGR